MRGRKPKPRRLKLLHGQRVSDEDIRPIPAAHSEPPAHLTRAAKAIWRAQAQVVIDAGLLSVADLEAYGRLCELIATMRRLTKLIDREGEILETTVLDSNGKSVKKLKPHPAVAVLRAAEKEWRQLGGLFGFSPSSRKQFGIEPEQPPDEFEQFLNDEKRTAS